MNEKEVIKELIKVSGYVDFLVIFKNECNPQKWGEYFIQNRVIVIYTLDEDGNRICDEDIMRIALHELTHHNLLAHTEGYERAEEHCGKFKEQFAKYLNLYYNDKVPSRTLGIIKEEGLNVPSEKKRKLNFRRRADENKQFTITKTNMDKGMELYI